jgi:Kef-type K+ transport system membrane component KefB
MWDQSKMTLLALILAALIWLGISFLFAAWFCPRLFRFTPKDDE